jgi:hypothetical protein
MMERRKEVSVCCDTIGRGVSIKARKTKRPRSQSRTGNITRLKRAH